MEELDLRELFRNFWSKKVQIILVIAIFVVLGFMYSYIFLEPSYQSVTSILLAKSNTSNAENEGSITTTDITLNQKLVSTYSELIKSESVLNQVINNLNIDRTTENLKENITVLAKQDTEIIEIAVTDSNPKMAKRIADEAAQVFIAKIAKEYYNMDNVYVVDEAQVAEKPYNINHSKDLVLFGMLGFVVACGLIIFSNMLDTTVKSKEDIEKKLGLTVLTTIPMCNFNQGKGGKR